MTASKPARRITDLQRSAFWIYGVTAMVMREPLAVVVRHTSDLGFGNWQVQLELLRVGVILLLLSRLFLISGLYFEQVYMRPESADSYPRRSYPIDFLAGLAQFLMAAAASTAVALPSASTLTPFAILVGAFLAVDWLWLAIAAVRRFSSLAVVTRQAQFNAQTLGAAALAFFLARVAGEDPVFSEQTALLVVAAFVVVDIGLQIRRYERLD